ncbi:unnamed protein product [Cyprideis torosa]|uniref:Uncharacterized protein n=1 Tax=Cyprideis torosa TaxID=163714 RepID=A0A7R8WQD8_9CRUS|nr:unnamed protein product [Cyprideis torosa]CAG0907675.1 unnamed protein product [Cyprideis torosa]
MMKVLARQEGRRPTGARASLLQRKNSKMLRFLKTSRMTLRRRWMKPMTKTRRWKRCWRCEKVEAQRKSSLSSGRDTPTSTIPGKSECLLLTV